MHPSTFSIVAFDPDTGDFGVAVQSKFLAVGAVVPWARAGVGAIATQAHANVSFGPAGLVRTALLVLACYCMLAMSFSKNPMCLLSLTRCSIISRPSSAACARMPRW